MTWNLAYPNGSQHWLVDPQGYAIDQERYRHDGALDWFGEYAMFVLLWDISDHEAGRVDRCSVCYVPYGKVAETYKQPAKRECESCFGTTFEGGIKAKIVRPSLWDVNEEDEQQMERGEVVIQTANVQATSDFRLRTDDYILRADGSRWKMRSMSTNALRTGFLSPEFRTEVGWNYGTAHREDESSVVYTIPPDEATLVAALDVRDIRYPKDFSTLEEVNGPLMPT